MENLQSEFAKPLWYMHLADLGRTATNAEFLRSYIALMLHFQDWISDAVDIRQLLIETHSLARNANLQPSEFFDDIQRAGFAMFSREPNIFRTVCGRAVEWSFVKLDKAFFGVASIDARL
jgi:Methyltransferase domain